MRLLSAILLPTLMLGCEPSAPPAARWQLERDAQLDTYWNAQVALKRAIADSILIAARDSIATERFDLLLHRGDSLLRAGDTMNAVIAWRSIPVYPIGTPRSQQVLSRFEPKEILRYMSDHPPGWVDD